VGQLRHLRRGDGKAGQLTWREWALAGVLGAAFLLALAWRLGWRIGLPG